MNKVLIAVCIPVLVLLSWVASIEYGIASGTRVRLRVAGYDPRDLLTGHFIRYRVTDTSCSSPPGVDSCLCLKPKADGIFHSPAGDAACAERAPACEIFVKGECRYGQFEAGLDRFSIPENLAPALQTIPPDSSIVVSIDAEGHARVLQMLVGEEDLLDYARKKL